MLYQHLDTNTDEKHSQLGTSSEDEYSLMDYQCTPIPIFSPPCNMENTITLQLHAQEGQGHTQYLFQDHQRSQTVTPSAKKPQQQIAKHQHKEK